MTFTPPGWWNASVVVYRRHTDASTDVTTWRPTVYGQCSWQSTRSIHVQEGVALHDSNLIVRIPRRGSMIPSIKVDDVVIRRNDGDRSKYAVLSDSEMRDMRKTATGKGYLVFNVLEVSDNTNDAVGMPHVRLRCG